MRQRLGTALELARRDATDVLEARQLADARARLNEVDLRRAFRPRLARTAAGGRRGRDGDDASARRVAESAGRSSCAAPRGAGGRRACRRARGGDRRRGRRGERREPRSAPRGARARAARAGPPAARAGRRPRGDPGTHRLRAGGALTTDRSAGRRARRGPDPAGPCGVAGSHRRPRGESRRAIRRKRPATWRSSPRARTS